MYSAAANWFCSLPWTDVLKKFPMSPYLPTYCFQTTYISALLTQGLGFPENMNVTAVDSVANVEAGWALGAMTYQAGLLPWVPPPLDPPAGTRFILTPAGIAVASLGILLFAVAISLLVCRCRRCQLLSNDKKLYETV